MTLYQFQVYNIMIRHLYGFQNGHHNNSSYRMSPCLCAQSLQSCPTLCNPMNCSLPGTSVHGILQPRKNTGVGNCALLQGTFWTQGLKLHLLHLLHWQITDYKCHLGSPYAFIQSYKTFFVYVCVMFKIYFLSNFHICSMMLLTIVPMLNPHGLF